ncbi:MAG: hypothetical protein KME65_00010 [Candidatus Thiodiazotropha sp. (ex Ctena orbiculata)]|uniref:Uncharacterized protein n=1 Tax=Candidatus Thiodiazotropha taylori TaxID=2792791 RepID=A0A944M5U2_9GAMM|nr:hypothetical protein [Candidatus Thiodiazotropha taylori]MBV2138434.1 hypothetical protein [Candidatus Thiodiazotropha taylori]
MPSIYPRDALNGYKHIHKANCFVIMPFAPEFNNVWEVIRDTLQSVDLNFICQRADDFRAPNILETILNGIFRAEFIIADLTDENPNVFYELGIAHCAKDSNNVVLLTKDMKFVPFDLRHLRCITYSDSADGMVDLKKELIATFSEYSKDAFRFKVREGKRFIFGKKLVGEGRNLYSLVIECPHVGEDAVKVMVHYNKYSIDETDNPDSQFLFLSEDRRTERLSTIPWYLHLVTSDNNEALLQLDKIR